MNERRMSQIFRQDGRALIVALDHGLIDGPIEGLESPARTIRKIVEGGADAVLTSYGVARRFPQELADVGLILRADGGSTSLGTLEGPSAICFSVEEALRLGADALALSAFPGSENEAESLHNLAVLAGEAHGWGLPLLAEMVPGGFDSGPEHRTPEAIALSARVGAELGGDFIKAPYADGYDEVTENCYVPVVILGGSKRGDEGAILTDIEAALQAGAAGVAIGRNIFQAEDPIAMTAAVAKLIHEGARAKDLAAELVAEFS